MYKIAGCDLDLCLSSLTTTEARQHEPTETSQSSGAALEGPAVRCTKHMIEGLVPYSDDDSAATGSLDGDDQTAAVEHQQGGATGSAGHTDASAEYRYFTGRNLNDTQVMVLPSIGRKLRCAVIRPAKRARLAGSAGAADPADTPTPSRKLQTLRDFPHQEGNFATTVFLPGEPAPARLVVVVSPKSCGMGEQTWHLLLQCASVMPSMRRCRTCMTR